MKYFWLFGLINLVIIGCGGTSLDDGLSISGGAGGSLPSVVMETTDTPSITGSNPASPNVSQTPAITGTAEANAAVEIFSDSSCSISVGTGTADGAGNFSVTVNTSVVGGTVQDYYARATADGESVSNCSSTTVNYRSTAIRPGLGFFTGNQTTAPGTPTQINQATAYALQWSSSEFDSTYFSHDTGMNSQTITIQQPGDYWVSATVPMIMTAGTFRPAVRVEVRVNGVLYTGAIGQSTYIRFDAGTGNDESSGHVAILLRSLSASDTVEVFVQETAGQDGSEVVSVSGAAALYLEYAGASRTIFTAEATRTVANTNINSGISPFEWTEGRKDTGFTHDDVTNPEDITLSAGTYLVFVNLPINSNSTRTSPKLLVRLNGATVNGGQASQGYIRNDSGHNDSSLHWSGYITASNGDVLQITSESEAGGGTTIVQAGQQATINIEKLSNNDGMIALRATQLAAGANWNVGGGSSIAWANSDIHDTSVFSHDTTTNNHQITVNEHGDYLLVYNDSLSSNVQRASPIIRVLVNGVPLQGAEVKTHYIRNQNGHAESSGSLVFLLRNLSPTDVISLTSEQEVAAGTANIIEDALLSIIKK